MRTGRGTLLALAACAVGACGGDGDGGDAAVDYAGADTGPIPFEVTLQPEDSVIFEERMAWAARERLDTLPFGETVVALGRQWVGAPYTPGTLEVEGPERLVINLRGLDCVTYVESMLAMARAIHLGTPTFDAFKRELARLRYRDGVPEGYTSRLHYFSEWIANNDTKGLVDDVTAELGGVVDDEPITFMTAHPDAYRQFADPGIPEAIREIELELSGRERHYIPQQAVAAVADRVRNGDVIAATSTLDGLDIAHTGFALWVDGRLHLMHAPLVGSVIEISERPLAERLIGIEAQDGIMVARPVPPTRTAATAGPGSRSAGTPDR